MGQGTKYRRRDVVNGLDLNKFGIMLLNRVAMRTDSGRKTIEKLETMYLKGEQRTIAGMLAVLPAYMA